MWRTENVDGVGDRHHVRKQHHMFDLIGRGDAHELAAVLVVGAAQHQRHPLELLQPVHQVVHVLGLARIGDGVDHQRDKARLAVVERARQRIGTIAVLSASARMRARVSGLMRESALKARDTVADDTPAIFASSIEVTPFGAVQSLRPSQFAPTSIAIDLPSAAADTLIASQSRAKRNPFITVDGLGIRPSRTALKVCIGVSTISLTSRTAAPPPMDDLAPAAPGVDPHDRVGIKEGDRRRTAGRPVAGGVEGHERAVGETRGHRTDQIDIEPAIVGKGGEPHELGISPVRRPCSSCARRCRT